MILDYVWTVDYVSPSQSTRLLMIENANSTHAQFSPLHHTHTG